MDDLLGLGIFSINADLLLMNEPKNLREIPDFVDYVYDKLWQAAGASEIWTPQSPYGYRQLTMYGRLCSQG